MKPTRQSSNALSIEGVGNVCCCGGGETYFGYNSVSNVCCGVWCVCIGKII